jgi:hypothetical protein
MNEIKSSGTYRIYIADSPEGEFIYVWQMYNLSQVISVYFRDTSGAVILADHIDIPYVPTEKDVYQIIQDAEVFVL